MSQETLAAPVLLGSNLLTAARAQGARRPGPASSGSAAIDDKALDGGFRYGEITSMAGASGTGKVLIAYHAIANHLLKHELEEVALIDTTGSFSPLRLRDVLVFRLQARLERERYQQSGYVYEKAPLPREHSKENLVDQATSMLDRVKVMRVFDFAGVVEAVAEIALMLEAVQREDSELSGAVPTTRQSEVADSEDELDDLENEGDLPSKQPSSSNDGVDGRIGQLGMLIIDSISSVLSAVMSKSRIQGHALLTTFMRSLHHLTGWYHLCTILLTAAVGLNSSNNADYRRHPDDQVSIFPSTIGKPALGKTFTYLVDTSIFVSAVPRTSEDATIAMGDGGQSFEKTLIMEILKDRHGSREGRWAAFQIADGVKLMPRHG